MRYSGVLISGFLGGMGGALFAQSIAGRFAVTTIAGQGFISMAAMIFGKWNPLGAMALQFSSALRKTSVSLADNCQSFPPFQRFIYKQHHMR